MFTNIISPKKFINDFPQKLICPKIIVLLFFKICIYSMFQNMRDRAQENLNRALRASTWVSLFASSRTAAAPVRVYRPTTNADPLKRRTSVIVLGTIQSIRLLRKFECWTALSKCSQKSSDIYSRSLIMSIWFAVMLLTLDESISLTPTFMIAE